MYIYTYILPQRAHANEAREQRCSRPRTPRFHLPTDLTFPHFFEVRVLLLPSFFPKCEMIMMSHCVDLVFLAIF